MAAETEKWGKVIRAANIKGEGLREAGRRETQGGRYETSPPKFLASSPGCRRAGGGIGDGGGAVLSDAAGAYCRRISSGWRRRHRRSPDGTMAVGAARPAIHHREPAGRRQQYRDRGGRARACRRLHAP